jgi:Lar family restriction alleviation protein
MNERIKSCPFCGSGEVEVSRTNRDACWIRCAGCGADAESDPSRAGAIANWNRRAEETDAVIVEDDDAEMMEDYLDRKK